MGKSFKWLGLALGLAAVLALTLGGTVLAADDDADACTGCDGAARQGRQAGNCYRVENAEALCAGDCGQECLGDGECTGDGECYREAGQGERACGQDGTCAGVENGGAFRGGRCGR